MISTIEEITRYILVKASIYPGDMPLYEKDKEFMKEIMEPMKPLFEGCLNASKKHGKTLEKYGYSIEDMAAGKIPVNYDQVRFLIKTVEIILKAANNYMEKFDKNA